MATANTGTILDVIHEKTANIEQATNAQLVKKGLALQIRAQANRERKLRESTITISHKDNLNHSEVIDIMESKWIEASKQLPVTFWQDKETSYCQFNDKATKEQFLDEARALSWPANEIEKKVRNNIIGLENRSIANYTRKPVKIELANVRANVKAELIKETLEIMTSASTLIEQFKEGKPHAVTKARSIYFRTNQQGVRKLFKEMDGAIPYNNKATNTRIKLFAKINSKPWQCRDCLIFGQHQCTGKVCNQCGLKGHETRDCKSKTKNCNNCKRRGHKAKDTHCNTYLNEVIKELRKMDIPIEYYEDKELTNQLINSLQIK